jgi:recombination protein RecA
MRIMDKLTRSGTVDIIVIDSVSALVPIEELEGEITDNHVGRQARMMSQGLRIIAGRASKTGTMIYFINQLRMKIGVMFGNPETTSGGNALKFYASVRLDIRRKGPIKEGKDDFIGAKTKVKIVKNKLAPPFKTCFFDILYGKGIDKLGDIIELGPQYDVLQKSGAWYSWGGENVGQGSENTKNWLRENPVIAETLYTEIMMRALPARFVQAEEATKEAVEEVEAVVDTD